MSKGPPHKGPDWRDPASYPEGWNARIGRVQHWMPATGRVADVGCGARMELRRMLPPGVAYVPADLRAWTPEVQEIDLDRGQFPPLRFDAVVMMGVLEYLEKPGLALRRARAASDLLVTSYVHPRGTDHAALRKTRGWINAFTEAALERLFARQGWAVAETILYNENNHCRQVLYRCAGCAPVLSPALGLLARQVRAERLTYLRPEKMARLETALAEAGRRAVQGVFAEFGLALGGSGIVIAQAARDQGRAFHGFDVFAQIPAPASEHDDDLSRARYAVIAGGQSRGIGGDTYYGYRESLFDEVSATFGRFGLPVDGDGVALHRGLFEETWPLQRPAPVAFAHVDCDWYDPVLYCLEALETVMPPGGLILLDDYHDYGGARKAVDTFLAAHPDFMFSDGPNVLLERLAV